MVPNEIAIRSILFPRYSPKEQENDPKHATSTKWLIRELIFQDTLMNAIHIDR